MKTIHIYDMDDTMFEAPTFSSFVENGSEGNIDTDIYFPEYFKKVKSLFWNNLSKEVVFRKSNDYVLAINPITNKPYDESQMEYFSKDKKAERVLKLINGMITISSFPGFHSEPKTLGKIVNDEVLEKYNKAENRMILTGRGEKMRFFIEKILDDLNIKYPNYGLMLYPGSPNIKEFKAETIIKTIEENDWEEVHFYEDREDWLHYAEGKVNEKFPHVIFVPHLIKNVHNKRKFSNN
jgi:hypothetical protein